MFSIPQISSFRHTFGVFPQPVKPICFAPFTARLKSCSDTRPRIIPIEACSDTRQKIIPTEVVPRYKAQRARDISIRSQNLLTTAGTCIYAPTITTVASRRNRNSYGGELNHGNDKGGAVRTVNKMRLSRWRKPNVAKVSKIDQFLIFSLSDTLEYVGKPTLMPQVRLGSSQ